MYSTEFKYIVLTVDDIPKSLQILGNILDEHKIDISFATSGKQAILLAETNLPDLILLDISMPEMDGYEVCKKIRASETTKEIPVIFLTAHTETQNIIEGFNSGGQDYVTKPFNPEELLARVFTHIELKNKRLELKKQTKELSELNLQLKDQKNEISQKNKFLTDSIGYAQIIQNSLLSHIDKLKTYFPNSFIFFRPKDIVSGDFYFFDKIERPESEYHANSVIAAADCTGHGVPGALLTVLGITLLKQMIVYDKQANPAEILYRLNHEITNTLANTDNTERSQDGMDIAICNIDTKKNLLTFSGCKRSIYLIRNKQLTEIRGSIHSVGGYYDKDKKEFKNQYFALEKGDRIYMFSDGFTDQFGGERNKKFTSKRFRNLLIDSSVLPINEQFDAVNQTWLNWKENNEQVDDVLLLCFEF